MARSKASANRLEAVGRLTGASACLAFSLVARTVGAQVIQRSTLLIDIPRLSQLIISGDISGLLTMSAAGPGQTAYDLGYVESASDGTVLTLNTNDRWDLSAKLGSDWGCPGTYDKDEADLYLRITNTPTGTIENGADQYINLTGADRLILSHDSAVADDPVDIQTKVLLDWTRDVPGTYSITLTYTLTTHLP